jgi:hypothetical protein
MEMEGLEQNCQRRRCKRLSRWRVENDDEFAVFAAFWCRPLVDSQKKAADPVRSAALMVRLA